MYVCLLFYWRKIIIAVEESEVSVSLNVKTILTAPYGQKYVNTWLLNIQLQYYGINIT